MGAAVGREQYPNGDWSVVGFRATADRIRATDRHGVTKFDTDQKLFHIVGAPIVGYRDYAAQWTSGGTINTITTEVVGSCHAACTHIIGAVKFTPSGSTGGNIFMPGAVGPNMWSTYLGGTLVYMLDGPNITLGQLGGTYRHVVTSVCTYRFYKSGTSVVLEKHLAMEAYRAYYLEIAQHRLDFNLKAGLFT